MEDPSVFTHIRPSTQSEFPVSFWGSDTERKSQTLWLLLATWRDGVSQRNIDMINVIVVMHFGVFCRKNKKVVMFSVWDTAGSEHWKTVFFSTSLKTAVLFSTSVSLSRQLYQSHKPENVMFNVISLQSNLFRSLVENKRLPTSFCVGHKLDQLFNT